MTCEDLKETPFEPPGTTSGNAESAQTVIGFLSQSGLHTMARISKDLVESQDGKASLAPRHVIVVRVASFAFRFATVERLRECIKYYEKKTRPSTRISARVLAADVGEDWRRLRGWDVERWFERLPMYLLEGPKRQKVLKALSKALALAEAGKL
jgi:hypothetical protein